MNQIRLRILCYLTQQTEYTSYAKLAEEFAITDRVARKYVDGLEGFLRAKGMGGVERKYGEGIRIAVTPQWKQYILNWQTQRTPYQYVYSREERSEIILATLLLENQPLLQKNFAKLMNVSEGTIVREMNQVQRVLEENGLQLVRIQNIGAYVTGGELARQKLLLTVYRSNVNFCNLSAYLQGDLSHIDGSQIMEALIRRLSDNGRAIFDGIKRVEQGCGLQFSDGAFVQIFLRAAILIARRAAGAAIEPLRQGPPLTDGGGMVSLWGDALERQYGGRLTDAERTYLLASCLCAKTVCGSMLDQTQEAELRGVVDRMVDLYEQVSGVGFGQLREELSDGLVDHLRPVVYSLRLGLPVGGGCPAGSLTERSILTDVKMAITELEQYIGEAIDDNEIAYLAVHFGAIRLKMAKALNKRCKVLLVCGAGVGISNLIAIQLHQQFDVDAIITASSRQFHQIPKDSYQCVISTMQIEGLNPKDYVLISSRYTEEDQRKVAQALDRILSGESSYGRMVSVTSGLIDRLERHGLVADRQQLQIEFIDELMKNNRAVRPAEQAPASEELNLWDIVTEDAISLAYPARDWEDAVRAGAALLENVGAVADDYKESIVDNIRRLGPYMAIRPQVFLSHAENRGNVRRVAISVLTLAQGIAFGDSDCNPIRLVITLCATDSASHLHAIAQLFGLLRNPENANKLINCKSRAAAMKWIGQARQGGTAFG